MERDLLNWMRLPGQLASLVTPGAGTSRKRETTKERGMAELREFYKAFLTKPPPGFPKAFELLRRDVDGEVAYIVWKAEPGVQLATDTFLVRDRKIMVQTFAASLAA
jgi:hypothetical protein